MRYLSYQSWLQILFAAVFGLISFSAIQAGLPNERSPREIALIESAQKSTLTSLGESRNIAERLCKDVSNRPPKDVDCLFPFGPDQPDVDWVRSSVPAKFAASQVNIQLDNWRLVLVQLERIAINQSQSEWLVASLRSRVNQIENLLRPETLNYERLFQAALLAEGVRYNSITGRFSMVRWDSARIFDDQERLVDRSTLLKNSLQGLPIGFGLSASLLMLIALKRHSWPAMPVLLIGMGALGLSLCVIGDASLRFGEGSYGFAINPFSFALPRQILSILGCITICLFIFLNPNIVGKFAALTLRHIALVSLLGAGATLMTYSFMSPAAGSEMLKIWAALMASLALTRYARASFTARSIVPKLWNPLKILHATWIQFHRLIAGSNSDPQVHRADDLIRVKLFYAIGVIFLSGMVVLTMTAGVFSDLGGSLISATILWALLVLLFGPSVGLGALGIGALLAFIALQTDKVAGRLELMLNPMSALISDFARLEKFRSAASDVGYHLGQVQWCSFEGSCLPLQSLSDYMPILLVSTLGFWPSVAVTGLVGSFYIVLMIVSINGIGRYPGSIRVIYSFAFFLLLASLTQALLTILGSFRLIPLTGLGLPMFSLGISSLLSAILAPTFIGIASALTKQQETPA